MQVVAGATLFFTTGIAVLMGGGGNLGFLHLIAGVDLTRADILGAEVDGKLVSVVGGQALAS